MTDQFNVQGFTILPGYLSPVAQAALLEPLRNIIRAAPMYRPQTPGGRKMSVRMTSAGRFGWVSDGMGYRYSEHHPSGQTWPPIPDDILTIWHSLSNSQRDPECCLLNLYDAKSRMSLHQDKDETDFHQPVLSISLGCSGRFRMGQKDRKERTQAIWLHSGDVVVMGGTARLAYHGIDKIRLGSSQLLGQEQRLNITLRVVT
jgi:DNA oxidative demethylase